MVEVLTRPRGDYKDYYVVLSTRQGDQLHFVVYYIGWNEGTPAKLEDYGLEVRERFLETEVAQCRVSLLTIAHTKCLIVISNTLRRNVGMDREYTLVDCDVSDYVDKRVMEAFGL